MSSACSRKQRRAIAVLAGLTAEWVDSDQTISENVTDLAGKQVTELYEPYQFLRSPPGASGGSHRKGNARMQMRSQGEDPLTLFGVQMATRPLLNTKGFWKAMVAATVPRLLKPCHLRRCGAFFSGRYARLH